MDRRQGLRCAVGIIVGAAASPAALAQPASRLPRIDILLFGTVPSGSPPEPADRFSTRLSELGCVEGSDIVVELDGRQVERPGKFRLTLNPKTAKAIGVAVPQSLLLRADELIA